MLIMWTGCGALADRVNTGHKGPAFCESWKAGRGNPEMETPVEILRPDGGRLSRHHPRCIIPASGKPAVIIALIQNHRHRLGVHRTDQRVGLGR